MATRFSTFPAQGFLAYSGYSGNYTQTSGYSGKSGATSGYSGFSGASGTSGYSGSGFSGASGALVNRTADYSVTGQNITAARAFITDSFLQPSTGFRVGSAMKWVIGVNRTDSTSTARVVVDICFGTTGTTSDTARVTWTQLASTASGPQTCSITIEAYVQSYSATGVVAGCFQQVKAGTSPTVSMRTQGYSVVSGAFDLTTASLGAGICITGGTNTAWTINSITSEFIY